MSSTFFGLTIGYSGLSAYQAAVNTTANNVANVETEGYTRQKVSQKAASALRTYTTYGMAGAGTCVAGVEQIRDIYYDIKYWNASSKLGEYNIKNEYMSQIENYFNDDADTIRGFNTIYDEFYNALEDVQNNPGDVSTRTAFVGKASSLCEYFNSLSEQLTKLQDSCNTQIRDSVDQINTIATQIATLNKQINIIELSNGAANELRDQRALLVDKLSTFIDVEVSEDPIYTTSEVDANGDLIGEPTGTNRYTVKIAGNQILVDGYEYRTLEIKANESWDKINQSDADGLYKIYWTDTGLEYNPCNPNYSGTLKGLLEIRDGNNGEYFHGTIKEVSGKEIKITAETQAKTLQELMTNSALNATGSITLGSGDYRYESWSVEQEADGTFTYTFVLADNEKQNLDNSGERLKIEKVATQVGKSAQVGDNIDYQGIPYYQEQLNEWVRLFAQAFNEIEYTGEDVYGDKLAYYDAAGTVIKSATAGDTVYDAKGNAITLTENYTGPMSVFVADSLTDYTFKDNYDTSFGSDSDTYYQLTAANFMVNTYVAEDAGRLSTTSTQGSLNLEKHDIVDELEKLKDKSNFFRGASSAGFLQCVLSDIALNTNSANTFTTNYTNIQSSVENQRLSISGVDNDEEALNLVKFQNAYNLSAKMIQVMTEMYDKLINQTGV